MLKKPKFWDKDHDTIFSIILIPFTIVLVIKNWMNQFYNRKNFKIKSVCVGNIYLGGTGKTPLTIEIYKIFKKLKLKPVFIKKFHPNQKDERRILKKIGPVLSYKKRQVSIEEASNRKFKVAIVDDGLQDYSIDYDLKIVCFDKKSFIGNGRLIPSGPLRENLKSLKNFDILFFNGYEKLNKKLIKTVLSINKNIKVFETYQKFLNLNKLKKSKKYLIFSGIGTPSNFKSLLLKNNIKISKYFEFPDHHDFRNHEISEIKNLAKKNDLKILTTEKDYLRLDKHDRTGIEFLKIESIIKNKKKFIKLLKKI